VATVSQMMKAAVLAGPNQLDGETKKEAEKDEKVLQGK
jgi:hypothetical protein